MILKCLCYLLKLLSCSKNERRLALSWRFKSLLKCLCYLLGTLTTLTTAPLSAQPKAPPLTAPPLTAPPLTAPPLTAHAAYLSPRLTSAGEAQRGYHSAEVLSLSAAGRYELTNAWRLNSELGGLLWQSSFHPTPTREALSDPSTPLTPLPEQALGWRGALSAGVGLTRSSQALTFRLSGGLSWAPLSSKSPTSTSDPILSALSPQEALSVWGSAHLLWVPQGLGEGWLPPLWLSARWGGGSLGGASEPLELSVTHRRVSAGLMLGRASLGAHLAWLEERLGMGAGLALPLSAPLYLTAQLWLDRQGSAEGRLMSVGLRWTGEREAPELTPPKPNNAQPTQPSPRAPTFNPLAPSQLPHTTSAPLNTPL